MNTPPISWAVLPAFGLPVVGDDDAGAAIGQLACGGRTDSDAAGDGCTGSIADPRPEAFYGEPTDRPGGSAGAGELRRFFCHGGNNTAAPPGSLAEDPELTRSSFSANSARRPTGRIGGECLAVAEQIRRSGARRGPAFVRRARRTPASPTPCGTMPLATRPAHGSGTGMRPTALPAR